MERHKYNLELVKFKIPMLRNFLPKQHKWLKIALLFIFIIIIYVQIIFL